MPTEALSKQDRSSTITLQRPSPRAIVLALQLGAAAALGACGGGTSDVADRSAQAQPADAQIESTRKTALATAPATLTDSDALRYLCSYADLRAAFGLDIAAAKAHYLSRGRIEGRTLTFEAERYIASYPDLIAAFGTNIDAGMRHYIIAGASEGRVISFDAIRYVASYPDLVRAFGTDTAAASLHYINRAATEGRIVNFDTLRYVASYVDLIAAFAKNLAAAVTHYVTAGFYEGRTLTFNAAQYLANYADLRTAFGTNATAATQHFVNIGWAEGRTDKVIVDPNAFTCVNTNVANLIGATDPFAVNAWHLRNTGPTQVVSADNNDAALAGADLNVEPAHRGGVGCTGKGVTVAIVDSGLELAHEDLAPAVLAGKSFNFLNNTGDPSPEPAQAEVDHGTGVAGIAVARGWNGKGSRGTAPFASVVGYNLIGFGFNTNVATLSFGARPLADVADAQTGLFGTRADAVDVFNFSAGVDYANPKLAAADPLDQTRMHRAMEYATANLRGGRGAVIFQSGGNAFNSFRDGRTVTCATFRTAVTTGIFTNPEALTCGSPDHEPEYKPFAYNVASIHTTGRAASYSSAGASNWVTGTGGEFGINDVAVISTDNSGCNSGFNNVANRGALEAFRITLTRLIADLLGASTIDPNCNYTGRMNGTSAAAPSVAGVTALLLEANPRLTWQDVGYILAKTSRKVDAGIAVGNRAVNFKLNGAAAAVDLDLPWLTNAAGFNFQNRYGFGLADADAATKLAAQFTTPAGRRNADLTAVGGVSAAEPAADAANGAQNYVSTAQFANAAALTGQIRVDVAVTNQGSLPLNPGLLQFELVNKVTGTRSLLMPAYTGWFDGGALDPLAQTSTRTYRLHTNAFFGENLASAFEVRVRSFAKPGAGQTHALSFRPTLTSFSL